MLRNDLKSYPQGRIFRNEEVNILCLLHIINIPLDFDAPEKRGFPSLTRCLTGHYLQTSTALKILCICVTPFSIARLNSLRKEGKIRYIINIINILIFIKKLYSNRTQKLTKKSPVLIVPGKLPSPIIVNNLLFIF